MDERVDFQVASAEPAIVRRPVIHGPVIGGHIGRPYASSVVDLRPFGYVEQEYFVSGSAAAFNPRPGTALGRDGRWSAVAGDSANYTTRILVRRPPAKRFNGTVIVEFMQEYFNAERDTNFRWNAETLLREGFAWVGASLHHEGIDTNCQHEITLGELTVPAGPSLVQWDSARYRDLRFPHSDLCYDVLSQIGVAVGPDHGRCSVDPLPDLHVQRVVAVGNTIAAQRLQYYINAVHPLHGVFDGFYLQDLNESGVCLSAGIAGPEGAWLRTDVDVPTIVLNTMTAAVQDVPQPDADLLRFWEPAGSSHTTGPYMARVAEATRRDLGIESGVDALDSANTFPVQYVSGAAIVAVHRWAAEGVSAARTARLLRDGRPPQGSEVADIYGNASGGLRTPWVDAPIARYDWRGDGLGGSGRTYPFTTRQLIEIYGTPAEYHRRFAAAAHDALALGTLLIDDVEQAVEAAGKVTW
ncbi:alpha/beta hydrolase domain-containing protein [Mycobacterium sp. AMU20-3851]|uniref:alpha/beta hydrolase domain-containing protein n=1 Tax=Mycobacterium sp. AMU20-3851 TaxID=3122055 RepID=UPI003754820E